MPSHPKREPFVVDGPAGPLEALLESAVDEAPSAAAVVCHPHPLHGGTLNNKVAHTLARAFVASGMVTVRFNFRGVGESAGSFSEGEGEADDVLAVVTHMRERFPDLALWLAGFSFGAAMATRVANAASADGLVAVAPAATRLDDEGFVQPGCPWLIVHPEDDELVPIDETVAWVDALDPGPELVVFPQTSHFFHGQLVALRETVIDFVQRSGAAVAK